MVNWAQMYDCHGDVDRVPELVNRVECENAAEAWDEPGHVSGPLDLDPADAP
ncbi:hypothetical protein [Streptomyces sp. NPDC006274]|uniref:hypothetical protein n=1 Tax=unclassified Streptomyces TaxID=2593676 RepID=UPI0033A5AB5B